MITFLKSGTFAAVLYIHVSTAKVEIAKYCALKINVSLPWKGHQPAFLPIAKAVALQKEDDLRTLRTFKTELDLDLFNR